MHCMMTIPPYELVCNSYAPRLGLINDWFTPKLCETLHRPSVSIGSTT